MDVKCIILVGMLVTVFGVSGDFDPETFQDFRSQLGGNHFFRDRVPVARLPGYIVKIFHSQHFPFYQPGSADQYYRTESYPINYLPDFLRSNTRFGMGRYMSYLNRVFGHQKGAH